jgi:two-component system sensor histidine kinase UhpB
MSTNQPPPSAPAPRQASGRRADDTPLRSIAAHTPGLVYQFLLRANGEIAFPFVSEGCHSLLGIEARDLQLAPQRLLQIIEEEDRESYQEGMRNSASTLAAWNWEGRVRIESWNDTKWINLRAAPQRLDNGDVQWDGLMANITRGKLAELAIRDSRRQLAELSAHVEQVKEEERARIAREIHDVLGGNLTAIKMALSQVMRRLPDDAPLQERAQYLDLLVDRSIEDAHRISRDLRPSVLDLGIVAAIGWQAKEFQAQMDIPCYVVATEEELEIPKEQATALFRIFQEALTNIAKHSGASMVTVHISMSRNFVTLEVSDNGRGLSNADRTKPKSFGLRGMHERVLALGGELTVGAGVAGGCRVRARLPLP